MAGDTAIIPKRSAGGKGALSRGGIEYYRIVLSVVDWHSGGGIRDSRRNAKILRLNPSNRRRRSTERRVDYNIYRLYAMYVACCRT